MRVNGSIVLAILIAVGATVWIMSGQFDDRPATANAETANALRESYSQASMARVAVRESVAEAYVSVVRTAGQTEAARLVRIAAETEGRIASVAAEEGRRIEAGVEIVRLVEADRRARVAEADARVEHRRIEYKAADDLAGRGFQSAVRKAEAKAELETARAALAAAELDLSRTVVAAPIPGVLDNRPVEAGDYVKVGDPVATIVELDPLIISAQVSERQVPRLAIGMTATARLAAGEELTGIVRFISAIADEATRTTRIEIEVANPDYRLGQGLTADVEIPTDPVLAHPLPPSIFRLDALGRIGVMTVDTNGVVKFRPVTIIGSNDRGSWVTGLETRAQVIVIGQELVSEGETVTAVVEGSEAGS